MEKESLKKMSLLEGNISVVMSSFFKIGMSFVFIVVIKKKDSYVFDREHCKVFLQ